MERTASNLPTCKDLLAEERTISSGGKSEYTEKRLGGQKSRLTAFSQTFASTYGVVFLCVRMLQASSALDGSIATLPSSMCWMIPSLSITNVARLP